MSVFRVMLVGGPASGEDCTVEVGTAKIHVPEPHCDLREAWKIGGPLPEWIEASAESEPVIHKYNVKAFYLPDVNGKGVVYLGIHQSLRDEEALRYFATHLLHGWETDVPDLD